MAGGKGTRISSINNTVPKPMLEICGKPILEWQILNLKKCGLTDILIVIGHLGNVIKDYFGDGSKFGVNIKYFIEDKPLGTAGALFKLNMEEDFLLMCGDLIIDVDFNRFIEFHKSNNALATLLTHPNDHPYDSSLIVTKDKRVIEWLSKEDERLYYKNRVNSGIEIISPLLLKQVNTSVDKIDLDREVLKPNISSGKIYSYDTSEYIKDIGTPQRFTEVENDIKNGIVCSRNLKNKQKAIFLDRDGTINKYVGFLNKVEQLELIEGVSEAIKHINKSGYLAIVITNQPVIARGECSWEELNEIHNKLETELGRDGAFIDGIYICPHHPDRGFDGERIEYKIECDCRKPKCGLLLQAASDFNIDLSQSIMIGDTESDIKCGKSANCKKNILLERNKNNSLLEIVKKINENII